MCQSKHISKLRQEINCLLKCEQYRDTLDLLLCDLLKVRNFAICNKFIIQKYVDILQEFYYFVKRISVTDNIYLGNIKVLKQCTKKNWVSTSEEHGQIVKEVFFCILLNKNLHQHLGTFFTFKSAIAKVECSVNKFLSKQFEITLDIIQIHYRLQKIKLAIGHG